MFYRCLLLVAVTVLPVAVYGYATGAPDDVCDDMTPQHGVPPQKGGLPYAVTVNRRTVRPGGTVKIRIGPGAEKTFKGFLVQVRDRAGHAIGQLKPDRNGHTINCHNGRNNAATHESPEEKRQVDVDFIAPQKNGVYDVFVTVAKDGGTFWVQQRIAETIQVGN